MTSEFCPECNGRGYVETGEMEHGPAGIGYETVDCLECNGTGIIPQNDEDAA